MERDRIIEGIARPREDVPRALGDCPTPERLAAWLEGDGGDAETGALEAHVSDCRFCLEQLAILSRGRQAEANTEVPSTLQSEAVALGDQGAPTRRAPRVLPWASAAVVVLAAGLALTQFSTREGGREDEYRATRYAQPATPRPELLAPRPESRVVPAELVFRWTEVPGALHYDVRVVDEEGETLVRERVDGTRWLLPEGLALQPGHEYFARVDAWMDEGHYVSSEHRVFTVRSDD